MNYPTYGRSTRLVATGLSTLSSANAHIIGIMFTGTGTGSLAIYHGVTASGTVAFVRAYATAATATVNTAVYYPCPAYCSGGVTVGVGASADPNITLFWSPST